MMALHREFDDALFALAMYVALLLGLTVTAVGHVAMGPAKQAGMSGAHQWTSTYSVNNVAPLVAAATGFYAGQRGGVRAAAGGFVGVTAGYLVLFVGMHTFNEIILNVSQAGLQPIIQVGNAAGIGLTAALFAIIAARWE